MAATAFHQLAAGTRARRSADRRRRHGRRRARRKCSPNARTCAAMCSTSAGNCASTSASSPTASGCRARRRSSQSIRPDSKLYVMQALVGRLIHAERMLVATRKGLLQLARKNGGWSIARTSFPGVAVTAALHDARDGTLYAMLKHGHFGSKLHRSDDDGQTWTELAGAGLSGRCRRRADAVPDLDARSRRRRRAGRGCGPARCRPGCSRSDDRGEHWQQVSALWNVPEREKWFGGGYDDAGIHTISPDPRDAEPRIRRDLLRRRVGFARRRRKLDAARRRAGRGLYAAGAGRADARRRTRIAWRAAPPRPTRCGCSITAASSARPTPAPPGRSSSCRWTISASRSRRIRSDPLTAWFVPAIKDELRVPRDGALAVTRTSDGGKTWEIFRAGLPQRDAYRPGLPPRPRRRRHRQAARHGLDHRQPVGERQCRRGLAAGERPPAADLRGAAVLSARLIDRKAGRRPAMY